MLAIYIIPKSFFSTNKHIVFHFSLSPKKIMSREYKYVSLRDLLKTNPVKLTKFENAAPTFFMPSPEQEIEETSGD